MQISTLLRRFILIFHRHLFPCELSFTFCEFDTVDFLTRARACVHTHTHNRLTALSLELAGSAGTRKVKPIWILLKQETVSGSGISWAICKSAPSSRQITTPAPYHSVFYRPDALPAANQQRQSTEGTLFCLSEYKYRRNTPHVNAH